MKAYLVSISTATALLAGFGGGLAFSGLSAEAAIDNPRSEPANVCLDSAAKSALEGVVDSQICTGVNIRLGLSGQNKCNAAAHARRICFTWQQGNLDCLVRSSGSLSFSGTWTPRQPQ